MEKTALLVEDEVSLRLGLKIDLESNGHFEVWEAGDRPEAIDVLKNKGIPDIIITDIIMPSSKKAALELLTEVKANQEWRDIPIVVLSGRTASNDILEALQRGAVDYLVKPVLLEDLLHRANRAVERVGATSGRFRACYPYPIPSLLPLMITEAPHFSTLMSLVHLE